MTPMTPQEIADRIEIDDLITRYATAVDTKDWDLYRTVFTDDAVIDYTSAGGIRAFNLDPGFVVTERMETAQAAIGLGDYRGAPPSVPAAVVAWLCTGADIANGSTVLAQREALHGGLHPDWRER